MQMERRWWGGWKARPVAGLVAAVLVVALLSVFLAPRPLAPVAPHPTSPLATTATTATPASPNLVVPAGWKQALRGLVVSDFGHYNTLVTSAAKPSRVAACALPPHPWPVMAPPQFVLSDDGGRTWQQQAL